MQTFYIKQYSMLPTLHMALIEDGRNNFNNFYDAIQNSDITFTMKDDETDLVKIANAKAYISKIDDDGCTDKYQICYDWKKRDTNSSGYFTGVFEINFGKIKSDDSLRDDKTLSDSGKLIMPIRNELKIVILK